MPLERLHTSGHYGFQAVGSFIEPSASAHWNDVVGLKMDMQYFYGSVRSEAGDYWWPIRGCYADSARFLHLCESKIGGDFTYATDETSSYGGPVEHVQRNGRYEVVTPDGVTLMSVNDTSMEWNDGTELSITGELVGPGLQFFNPDEDDPLVYTSRLFKAAGMIKGIPVTGLVFHDSMHAKPGRKFITGPVITKLEAAWVAFATEFEDGTIHSGHLVHGTEGFNLMIVHRSDEPPLIARDVVVEAELDGDADSHTAFPVKVSYTGGGETWVWEAADGGRCPVRTELPQGHRWRQGWAHHADETRRPRTTEALMETYNGRLLDTGALREKVPQ
ncbi:hypothetical protein [Mycobacterium vicinigordonae]|uniref:Uncharacterized protein n=1 Tax=Mycobacterium vicinigordonae TaxID=1719132 RepID=A0A7D6IR01_9MYCO|nr:hypothetical protein [Mycobacterium vicinigordonae]QLL09800.1 hypothetical protein H0P51_13645 [Mycobacterium vicinigordonae]